MLPPLDAPIHQGFNPRSLRKASAITYGRAALAAVDGFNPRSLRKASAMAYHDLVWDVVVVSILARSEKRAQ